MAEERKSREDNKIKVVDRRLFNADGERRESDGEGTPEPAPPTAEPEAPPEASDTGAGFEHRPVEEPEGVDFTMLINAMAHPALVLLGEIPHPDSGQPTVHLEQARLQIDLLDLLRVKSRGNLTVDEERLIEKVLYELRMLYVTRSGGAG